jgi:hypothetical protein
MSTLLAIESAFLSKANIKQSLNLTAINRLKSTLSNGQKKKFDATLELAQQVNKSLEWFKSKEGKATMSEEGISWTTEEFANKVFGWQKSYFYKLVKAANVADETVDTFKLQCDTIERGGGSVERSIENLLKYAKQSESSNSEGGQGEGEGEGEGATVAANVPTIFTLSYKTENGNVAVRIDANGNVKTTNSNAEIDAAIQFLLQSITK